MGGNVQVADTTETARFRHVWLYAKYQYKRTDLLEDLKVIIGHETAIPPEQVKIADILTIVCEIAAPLICKQPDPSTAVLGLLARLQSKSRTHLKGDSSEEHLNWTMILEELLGFMTAHPVQDNNDEILVNLGEPDYSLLPPP